MLKESIIPEKKLIRLPNIIIYLNLLLKRMDRSAKHTDVEVNSEMFGKETKFFKSYFTYEPIDLIYKFYDKQEYRRLEQRFNFLLEFDISKCFYNIYAFNLVGQLRIKESAKRNARRQSFENSFDKLMQLANYNETNGIIVGPEVSRIFAEINSSKDRFELIETN